jgi:hypothetical protein
MGKKEIKKKKKKKQTAQMARGKTTNQWPNQSKNGMD